MGFEGVANTNYLFNLELWHENLFEHHPAAGIVKGQQQQSPQQQQQSPQQPEGAERLSSFKRLSNSFKRRSDSQELDPVVV